MAISITWADVVAIAAELSTLALGTQTAILAALPLQMSEDVWGVQLNLGATYLAAHMGTLARRRGAGGAVTGQTAGGVSRSMAAPWLASPFSSTSYGEIYEQLMLARPAARFDVG